MPRNVQGEVLVQKASQVILRVLAFCRPRRKCNATVVSCRANQSCHLVSALAVMKERSRQDADGSSAQDTPNTSNMMPSLGTRSFCRACCFLQITFIASEAADKVTVLFATEHNRSYTGRTKTQARSPVTMIPPFIHRLAVIPFTRIRKCSVCTLCQGKQLPIAREKPRSATNLQHLDHFARQ